MLELVFEIDNGNLWTDDIRKHRLYCTALGAKDFMTTDNNTRNVKYQFDIAETYLVITANAFMIKLNLNLPVGAKVLNMSACFDKDHAVCLELLLRDNLGNEFNRFIRYTYLKDKNRWTATSVDSNKCFNYLVFHKAFISDDNPNGVIKVCSKDNTYYYTNESSTVKYEIGSVENTEVWQVLYSKEKMRLQVLARPVK